MEKNAKLTPSSVQLDSILPIPLGTPPSDVTESLSRITGKKLPQHTCLSLLPIFPISLSSVDQTVRPAEEVFSSFSSPSSHISCSAFKNCNAKSSSRWKFRPQRKKPGMITVTLTSREQSTFRNVDHGIRVGKKKDE